ncbi:hypothetical protein PG988_001680 [Apiospora saccharicola]
MSRLIAFSERYRLFHVIKYVPRDLHTRYRLVAARRYPVSGLARRKVRSELSIKDLIKALIKILKILDGGVYFVFNTLDECPYIDYRLELDIRSEINNIINYTFNIEDLIKTDIEIVNVSVKRIYKLSVSPNILYLKI